MTYSDAQETSRRPTTRAAWRRLDSDVQARLRADTHKYATTKYGEVVPACRPTRLEWVIAEVLGR